jgi:foldase protein PrsA
LSKPKCVKSWWAIALLGVALSVAIAGCGGGIPDDAVVQVGSRSITKATYAHWMLVEATGSSMTPGRPVVPEPPAYTSCIAHLEATSAKPAKGQAKPTEGDLKGECEQQHKSLQQATLGFLISSAWIVGEAENLGVRVTGNEVQKELEATKRQQFPKAQEFQRYLATSGQTMSDLLLRAKLSLLSPEIQQHVIDSAGAKGEQAALSRFVREYKKKWTARTDCRAGYVVQDCRNYKASSSVAR